ncbi:MAG: hypothetical protein JWO62_1179 [Acidimicrobiaceae bacterium]|nr:hypothetical protein [Acidimicrobiaceae bacterium]
MRLINLELENFRAFRGQQQLTFASGKNGNVTVLYGNNGAGKTTLLNAFKWCLYGVLDADVEYPNRICHDGVWSDSALGSTVTAAVTLTFEHEDRIYRMRRAVRTIKNNNDQRHGEPDVTLNVTEPDGSTRDVVAWIDSIKIVLPEELSQFFFFNGERIERLVQRDAYTDIQTAIKTLLGLAQLERAIDHLPKAAAQFTEELKKLGDTQLTELTEKIDLLQADSDRHVETQKRLKHEMALLKDEQELVEQRLREHVATAQLQARRDDAQASQDSARVRLAKARTDRNALVTVQGFKAWASTLIPDVRAAADRLREKGELPSPIKRQFVDELLDAGTCICGASLEAGTEGHASVAEWRSKAGLAEVEGTWQQLRGMTDIFADGCAEFTTRLRAIEQELAEANEADRQARELLSQIKAELEKVPQEEPQQLEHRRDKIRDKLADMDFTLRDSVRTQAQVDADLISCQHQFRDAKSNNVQADLLRRRSAIALDAAKALRRILDETSEIVRVRLDGKVREVYDRTSIKDYQPELAPSFELQLWSGHEDDRALAPKSTGENQLLSLAFVGALAELCQEKAAEKGSATLMGMVGGYYPVVMDAAFGNLDNRYKEAVARALPSMASQVIVLTSQSQAEGVVADTLRGSVGAEYVITVHSTKDMGEETITLGGSEYPYVVSNADHNTAEITEVKS